MADIGALYVRILADVKTFGKDLKTKMSSAESEAEGSGKKVGGGFGKGLATAATAFAGLAVVDYMKNAGEAASELGVDVSRTKDVFEGASPSVLTWSRNAAQGLGLSQDQALTLANKLGTMYESMGMSSKGAAKLSESAVKLGTDLGTFYKTDPSSAINAIRMATLGAYRGMRQFGVSIDKNAVIAKALSMHLGTTTVSQTKLAAATKAVDSAELKATTTGNAARIAQLAYNDAIVKHGRGSEQAQKALLKLGTAQAKDRLAARGVALAHAHVSAVLKSGKTTLTQAQKAEATYALITQKTTKAQGAFAKEGNSLDVQNRKTRAEFKNMQAQLGTALLPVMTKVGNIIATQVAPALAKLAGFVAKNRATMVPLLGALTAFVIAVKAAKVVQSFGKDISAVAKGLKEMQLGQKLATAWTKLQTAAQWLLNAAMDANPIVLIVIAIAALIAILVIAYLKVGWFRAAVQVAFAAIAVAAKVVWNAVVVAFHWIVNAISGALNWLKINWPLVVGILLGPIGLAVGIFIRWRTQIMAIVSTAFLAILNVIRRVAGAIASFIATWVGRIVGFFQQLPGRLLALGAAAINAFQNGVVSAWGAVAGFFSSIGGRILGLIGNLGALLSGVGHAIVQGLISGVQAEWNGFKLFAQLGAKVVSAVGNLNHLLWQAGIDIITGLIGGITSMIGSLTSKLGSITKLIPIHKGPRQRDARLLLGAGTAIMGGLIGGIEAQVPALKATLGNVSNQIGVATRTAGRLDVAAAGVGARRNPTVENMYVQALDARHLAAAVADKLAYAELRGQTL
jgi:hypothetical protein